MIGIKFTNKMLFHKFLLLIILTFMGHTTHAAQFTISADSQTTIILPKQTILSEETAAEELQHYLSQMTGATYPIMRENQNLSAEGVAIHVGPTQFAKAHLKDKSTFESEEWAIQTTKNALILTGGQPRGALYAVYHFLEDICGVRWWNPWEESVPQQKVLSIPSLNKRSQPAFAYRDIYMLYGNDDGRFMARNRLNREGDASVSAKYGGSRNYGPPYHAHTFYKILSPEKYFETHPDWFHVPGGGAPTPRNSQLAMSNPEMRQEFLKLLREIIRESHHNAKENGLPVPDVFSVSQEDNPVSFITSADTGLLARNGGAESAILLDFVNYLADGIKDEFPDVYIDTLAYKQGDKAPTEIRPRDNVIIRLCDTGSNLILPITSERNRKFYDDIVTWSKITKNLRVWDYAINFTYTGLPLPTTQTYVPDLQFWKAHNVEGIFVEHERPVRADLRDFKIWLQAKLFEDPDQDYDALVREFTDGFYGPAGIFVRRYIYALHDEAKKAGEEEGYEDMKWFTPPRLFNFLSADFVVRADAMFDDAERAVKNDKVLLRRVRHARMPLDRYIARLHKELTAQWESYNRAETMPLQRDEVMARYSKTWEEQIELRIPDPRRAAAERKVLTDEMSNLTRVIYTRPAKSEEHSQFHPSLLKKATLFSPEDTRNYRALAKVVIDKDAPNGKATRLLMDDVTEADRGKYKLPMRWGIYDETMKETLLSNAIAAKDVSGSGYHWYKLGEIGLLPNTYLFLFWSWNIQIDLDAALDQENPDQVFEVWANLKFEGPMFPHGKNSEKDAISVAQVALVKQSDTNE